MAPIPTHRQDPHPLPATVESAPGNPPEALCDRKQDMNPRAEANDRRNVLRWCGMVLVLCAVLAARPAPAQEVRYLYDAKGQLTAVIDVDGSAAVYTWDENGNLLAITRADASGIPGAVGITLVNPSQGKPGDTVELYGKGFAATPAQNTLTFNGVAATVLAATPNYLMTTVPASATTGVLHLVAPLGAADVSRPYARHLA